MSKDLPELLSLKETSRILGVHRNTLRQWDQKGILKAVRYGQRQDRHFKKDDILQFIKKTQKNKKSQHNKWENADLKISLERVSRLQKITAELVKAVTIKDIANTIAYHGTKAFGAISGAIYLVSEKKDCIELFASVGYPQKMVTKLKKLSLKEVIPTTDAVKKAKPILIERHGECMLRYPNAFSKSFAGMSNAFAAIPISIKNEIIGVLSFSFSDSTHFSKDEITFMLTTASQFSNAFARAKRYDKVKIC